MRTLAAAGIIATAVGLTAFAGFAASQTGNQTTASGAQAQAPGVTPGGGPGSRRRIGPGSQAPGRSHQCAAPPAGRDD